MSEDVVFWKWISEIMFGLVIEIFVYYWDVFDLIQVVFVKVFDCYSNFINNQIINYWMSVDGKWMVVVGILQ